MNLAEIIILLYAIYGAIRLGNDVFDYFYKNKGVKNDI